MLEYRRKCALLGACLLLAGAAQAAVTVNYVQPDQFSDVPHTAEQRQRTLDDFSKHFSELGKDLRPDQDLVIDVLDIDLAGRQEPNRAGGDEIRVIRNGAEWPRMRLRYTLTQNGQVVAKGDAELSDQNFNNRVNSYAGDSRFSYEFQMIDDWWKKTIAPRAAGR